MGNIVTTIKRFLSNKNTITILGVLLGVVVLYIGYNYRVDQAIDTISIPYAKKAITATSEITQEMIGTTEVLRSFVNSKDNLITQTNQLINNTDPRCVTYGTSVPEGAFFYSEQVVSCSSAPNDPLQNMPDGYAAFSMSVNIHTTYGNSMYPGDYIDLYVKMTNDGKIIFGKLIESIEILDVRDTQGNSVFLTSEIETPSELLFAVPDELYSLLVKAQEVGELEAVPRNKAYTADPGETQVASEYVRNFILSLIFSKFKSLFKSLTLNSSTDIAFSIKLENLAFPYLIIYSSGSFAPSICKTRISQPIFCKISIALIFAFNPASSESKLKIICSVFFLSNQPCC